MPRKFTLYHYHKSAIHSANLFNLRDGDLRSGGGISKGDLTVGQCGYALAHADVCDCSVQTAKFLPNRCVEWQGFFLTCMALDGLPAGKRLRGTRASLRHRHYVVAELSGPRAIAKARSIGVMVIRSTDTRYLLNLEIYAVPQLTPPERWAKLL